VDIIEFFRWAIGKTKSNELYWPLLKGFIALPPASVEPISASGALVRVEQVVVPIDIKECQGLLAKAWREISSLRKENSALIKENSGLRVKRTRRGDAARDSANKRWKEKKQT